MPRRRQLRHLRSPGKASHFIFCRLHSWPIDLSASHALLVDVFCNITGSWFPSRTSMSALASSFARLSWCSCRGLISIFLDGTPLPGLLNLLLLSSVLCWTGVQGTLLIQRIVHVRRVGKFGGLPRCLHTLSPECLSHRHAPVYIPGHASGHEFCRRIAELRDIRRELDQKP